MFSMFRIHIFYVLLAILKGFDKIAKPKLLMAAKIHFQKIAELYKRVFLNLQ